MKQYLDLMNRIVDEGVWVTNPRSGVRCLTVIDAALEYDVGKNQFPLVTTRNTFWKSAIAELLGYIRGYTNAKDFRSVGTPTWDENANSNEAWLNNPNRKGTDDMGLVYGAVGNGFPEMRLVDIGTATERLEHTGTKIDLLNKVVNNLLNGIDDRGETWTFWHPGMFKLACLRPCMHTYTFSLLGDTLHLTAYQRSWDGPLGGVFNAPQPFVLLALIAQITGHKPGKVFHRIVNAHIYENQLDIYVNEQRPRTPGPTPKLTINPNIKTLEDLRTWVTVDDFEVIGYEPQAPIRYPFTV